MLRYADLSRPRLAALMQDGVALTLLSAPAGFGKSILLQQWATLLAPYSQIVRVSAPVTGEDHTPFWAAVRDACARDLGAEFDLARDPLDALRDYVAACDRPTLLLIDDFQRATSARLDIELGEFIRRAAELQVIVASPRFAALDGPLITGQIPVRVLGPEELAFTHEEIAQLAELRGLDRRSLPAFTHQVTLGWPLSVNTAIVQFERDRSQIGLEHALARMTQQFVTSIETPGAWEVYCLIVLCEGISLSLLTEVNDGYTADETKAALTALGDRGIVRREWHPTGPRFRRYGGYASYLEPSALRQVGAERARDAQHRNAIELMEEDPDGALVQLLALQDYDTASAVLMAHWPTVMVPNSGFVRAIQRVSFDDLKGSVLLSSARLQAEVVIPDTLPERIMDLNNRVYEIAMASLAGESTEAEQITALIVIVALESMRGTGGETMRRARELEHRIQLAQPPSIQALGVSMSFAHATLANAGLLNGDFDFAKREFLQALHAAEAHGNAAEQIRAWNGLAATAGFAGDLHAARDAVSRAEAIMSWSGVDAANLGWTNRRIAKTFISAEDLSSTVHEDPTFDDIAPYLGRIDEGALFILAEAALMRAMHGDQRALAVLAHRLSLLNSAFQAAPFLKIVLSSFRVDLLIYSGHMREASELLADLPSGWAEVTLSQARLHLFSGEAVEAASLAERILSLETTPRVRANAALIGAVAAWDSDESEVAIEYFATAAGLLGVQASMRQLGGVPYAPLVELSYAAAEAGVADLIDHVESLPKTMRPMRHEPLS